MRVAICDVCETRADVDEANWIEAKIPAAMLGELGDTYLIADICSLDCLGRLASPQEQDDEEEEEYVEQTTSNNQIGGVSIQVPNFRALSEEESESVTGVRRKR